MVSTAPPCTSTVCATAPAALITGWLAAAEGITTSSVAVGTWPMLQFVAGFQAVLVQPVQNVPAEVVTRPVLLVMIKVPPLRFCTTPVLVVILLGPVAFSMILPELIRSPKSVITEFELTFSKAPQP